MSDQPNYGAGDWVASLDTQLEYVQPEDLLANPGNVREHPGKQRNALRASLDTVGWVSPVVVNKRTQRIVDGHARVEEALSREALVPVVYIDVSEEQEKYILATFDPISLLAETNKSQLAELLDDVGETGSTDLDSLLASIAQKSPRIDFEPNLQPAKAFEPGSTLKSAEKIDAMFKRNNDDRFERQVICPSCLEEFSISD